MSSFVKTKKCSETKNNFHYFLFLSGRKWLRLRVSITPSPQKFHSLLEKICAGLGGGAWAVWRSRAGGVTRLWRANDQKSSGF